MTSTVCMCMCELVSIGEQNYEGCVSCMINIEESLPK